MVKWIKFVGFVVCGLFREWNMLFGGRLPVVSGGYNPACRGYNLIYTVTGRNLHTRIGQNVHLPT